MAFGPSGGALGGMSIDLEDAILRGGLSPTEFVTTPRWIGSVRFIAGDLRHRDLKVGYDPIPASDGDQGNPYHGEVWGSGPKSKQKELRRLADWFVPIPGVNLLPNT